MKKQLFSIVLLTSLYGQSLYSSQTASEQLGIPEAAYSALKVLQEDIASKTAKNASGEAIALARKAFNDLASLYGLDPASIAKRTAATAANAFGTFTDNTGQEIIKQAPSMGDAAQQVISAVSTNVEPLSDAAFMTFADNAGREILKEVPSVVVTAVAPGVAQEVVKAATEEVASAVAPVVAQEMASVVTSNVVPVAPVIAQQVVSEIGRRNFSGVASPLRLSEWFASKNLPSLGTPKFVGDMYNSLRNTSFGTPKFIDDIYNSVKNTSYKGLKDSGLSFASKTVKLAQEHPVETASLLGMAAIAGYSMYQAFMKASETVPTEKPLAVVPALVDNNKAFITTSVLNGDKLNRIYAVQYHNGGTLATNSDQLNSCITNNQFEFHVYGKNQMGETVYTDISTEMRKSVDELKRTNLDLYNKVLRVLIARDTWHQVDLRDTNSQETKNAKGLYDTCKRELEEALMAHSNSRGEVTSGADLENREGSGYLDEDLSF